MGEKNNQIEIIYGNDDLKEIISKTIERLIKEKIENVQN